VSDLRSLLGAAEGRKECRGGFQTRPYIVAFVVIEIWKSK
jgi:hypothetical protein